MANKRKAKRVYTRRDITDDLPENVISLSGDNQFFESAIMPFFQVGFKSMGMGISGLDILSQMGDKKHLDLVRIMTYLEYDKMEIDIPEIKVALDTYADITTMGTEGDDKAFEIVTDNKKVKKILEDLIERIDLNNKVWSIARDVKKYGDDFEEIITDEKKSRIERLRNLSVYTMNRKEDSQGIVTGFKQRDFEGKTIANLKPEQVIHLRYNRPRNLMPLDDKRHLYGMSMLYPLKRLHPLIVSMEEGMVVGRLYRSHDRYKIIVDCTGLDDKKTRARLNSYKKMFKKKNLYDPVTGQLDLSKMRILSPQDDFFIGAQKDGVTPDVQALSGQATLGNIEDVKYFQNKVFAVLKLPKAFLAYEGDINAKATLITEDTQFGRSVKRDQTFIASSLVRRVCDFELNLKGINTSKKKLYKILFAHVALEDEVRKLEIETSKIENGLSLLEAGLITDEYMILNYANIPVEDYDEYKSKLPKKVPPKDNSDKE